MSRGFNNLAHKRYKLHYDYFASNSNFAHFLLYDATSESPRKGLLTKRIAMALFVHAIISLMSFQLWVADGIGRGEIG